MAIKKRKKRRKRRAPQPVEVDSIENPEEQKKVQYKDDFQKTFGEKIEDFGDKLEGKGKTILAGLIGLFVIGVIVSIYFWNAQSTTRAGNTALGRAIETSSARITDVPLPAGSTEKVFKTKKARAESAIKEFDAIIAKYGGDIAAKAEYFKAMSRVDIDREAGAKELAAVAAKGGESGALAKFALAGIRTDDEKYDEAIKLYKELAALENPVVAKVTINSELASVYEKAGKKKEAAAIYFEIAKAAKDSSKPAEGGVPAPVQSAPSELEARTKLEELDPEMAKKLDEPESPAEGEKKEGEDEKKEDGKNEEDKK